MLTLRRITNRQLMLAFLPLALVSAGALRTSAHANTSATDEIKQQIVKPTPWPPKNVYTLMSETFSERHLAVKDVSIPVYGDSA